MAGFKTQTTGPIRQLESTARRKKTTRLTWKPEVRNARGLHAIRVLEPKNDFTLDSLIAAAFDSYLTGFEKLIPSLLSAYGPTATSNPLRQQVSEQITLLRTWDLRWSVSSVPTSLAVYWAEELLRVARDDARRAGLSVLEYAESGASPLLKLQALVAASEKLTADFGSWRTPWGEINRFQRLTGDIVQPFNDGQESIPVGFTSARWGSLASFGPAHTRARRSATVPAATALLR